MPKDLNQRLGLEYHHVRTLQAIQRYVTLPLLTYLTLIFLKILQLLQDNNVPLTFSIRFLALKVRKYILVDRIALQIKNPEDLIQAKYPRQLA